MKLLSDMGGFPQAGAPVLARPSALGPLTYGHTTYLLGRTGATFIVLGAAPAVTANGGVSLSITKNGSGLHYGDDFTVLANVVTLTASLLVTDKLRVDFRSDCPPQFETYVQPLNVTYDAWNPADKSANITLSGSNLIATDNANNDGWSIARSALGKSTSGKFYVEGTLTTFSGGGTPGYSNSFGFALSTHGLNTYLGASSGCGFYLGVGSGGTLKGEGGSFTSLTLSVASAGDIVMLAIDFAAGGGLCGVWVGKNGTWNGTGNPATGANPDSVFSASANVLYLATGAIDSSAITLNTGASAFAYAAPSGFTPGWYT
jgi:hypothetical protein